MNENSNLDNVQGHAPDSGSADPKPETQSNNPSESDTKREAGCVRRLVRSLLLERSHTEEFPTTFEGAENNIAKFLVRIPVTNEEKDLLHSNNYRLMLQPIFIRREDQPQKV